MNARSSPCGGNFEPTIDVVGAGLHGDYQPWEWTVTEAGFVGVGLVEDLSDNDTGFVLFSEDGQSWAMYNNLEGCCSSLASDGHALLGASYVGVTRWTPEPAELAVTGVARVPLFLTGSLMIISIGGLLLVASQRGQHQKR